jgi:thymidylate synthase (FAD)
MANMCVQINTERDIAAQILRHRSFSFQEYSTRYSKTAPAEIPYFRRQDTKNRQNSISDIHPQHQEDYQAGAGRIIADAFLFYDTLLERGVAKETARRILPLCTPTTLYMQGTLRSWVHYIQLRADNDTQLEHRQIAFQCAEVFKKCFPTVAEAVFPTLHL